MLATLFGFPAAASGHDPGLSEAELELGWDEIRLSWWIDAADLSGPLAAESALLLALDGAQRAPSSAQARETWDGHRLVRVRWRGVPRESLRITAALLAQLPLGHRLHLRVRDEFGRLAAEAVLSARDQTFEHRMADGQAPSAGTARGPEAPPALLPGLE
jgi:hypothetical protein